MLTETTEKRAHDLAVIWTQREFNLHTDGIPLQDWDAVPEAMRMDKLLNTYLNAYQYFLTKISSEKK